MQNIVLCLTNHMYFENTQALLYHRQLSQCNATNEMILHKGKNMPSGAGLYSTCVSWCGCSRHGTTFNWNKERSVQDSLSNVMTLTRQSFVLLRYSKVRAGGQTQTEFWGEWGRGMRLNPLVQSVEVELTVMMHTWGLIFGPVSINLTELPPTFRCVSARSNSVGPQWGQKGTIHFSSHVFGSYILTWSQNKLHCLWAVSLMQSN